MNVVHDLVSREADEPASGPSADADNEPAFGPSTESRKRKADETDEPASKRFKSSADHWSVELELNPAMRFYERFCLEGSVLELNGDKLSFTVTFRNPEGDWRRESAQMRLMPDRTVQLLTFSRANNHDFLSRMALMAMLPRILIHELGLSSFYTLDRKLAERLCQRPAREFQEKDGRYYLCGLDLRQLEPGETFCVMSRADYFALAEKDGRGMRGMEGDILGDYVAVLMRCGQRSAAVGFKFTNLKLFDDSRLEFPVLLMRGIHSYNRRVLALLEAMIKKLMLDGATTNFGLPFGNIVAIVADMPLPGMREILYNKAGGIETGYSYPAVILHEIIRLFSQETTEALKAARELVSNYPVSRQ